MGTRRLILGAVLALTGCERAEPPATFAVRDSAGVTIVESSAPRWGAEAGWRVDTLPSLSIGAVSGPPETSFSGISGMARLGDGSVVIADGSARELRFFDASGSFLRRFGARGDGPGEFQAIQTVGSSGDSIWIYDPQARRITFVNAASGGFRVAPVPEGNRWGISGRLADGSFVLNGNVRPDPSKDMLEPGFGRDGIVYVRVGPGGELLDTLLLAAGSERILRIGEQTIELFRPLYARAASHVAAGDHLVYGDQTAWELRAYGADGGLGRILRRSGVDLALGEREFLESIETRVASAPEEAQPGVRRLHEEQPRPNERPAYARLLADTDGNVWVQGYSLDAAATDWSVLDPEGVWLGVVRLPERFRPLEIRSEEILGVWRDELDVEYARAYPLRRR